jgi:hypothetical protein
MSVMKYVPCATCGRHCTVFRCRACNYATMAGHQFGITEVRMRRGPWITDALGRWRIVEGVGPGENM